MSKKNICIYSILILCLTACTEDIREKAVRENAEKYIRALAEYDFEAARPYATLETQQRTLDFIESNILPTIDSASIKQNTPAKLTIDSIVFSSDTSARVFYRKTTPIQTNTPATVDMRLRNGQWLAHQLIDFTIRMGTQPQQPHSKS